MVRVLRDNNHDERPTDKMGNAQDQKRPKATRRGLAMHWTIRAPTICTVDEAVSSSAAKTSSQTALRMVDE